MDARPLNVVVKEFNENTRELITKIEKKTRDEITLANLDRARKRISLLKSTMGDSALIGEAHPFFIDYAGRILESDEAIRENFFMTMDVKSEYIKTKGCVKREDEFVFALTDSIRVMYKKITRQEKDEVYALIKKMLACSIEYQMIKEEQK